MINQSQMMAGYNDENRTKFNDILFKRSDDDVIDQLKKVILSCQRENYFTIRVESFTVIEDYDEIYKILYTHEERIKNKGKKKDNLYSFINLKDSDIKLLAVRYFISIKDESERITVYIAIPRLVDKYYFRINGNIYSAMYQIVDGSTYNNSASNSKNSSVTFKTMFMPTRVYRIFYTMKTTEKETLKATFYSSRIFNKSLGGMKYILAKFGLYGTFRFLGIGCITLTTYDPKDEALYTFLKNDNIYINVPKMIFNADPMTQSLVCTIARSVNKDTTYDELFTNEYWIKSLGGEFNNFSIEKGMSILDSIESIYDISTKESIALPEDHKKDMYDILKWIMREFNNLRIKDNLDISTKKIRYAEYIASLYAMKISKGIYRVADLNKRANLDTIKKAISTPPLYLLGAITKCKLINYRNMVNDMDSIIALKFTYKGVSGLGEGSSNSIPDIYRAVNPSHIGRVDLDSSSSTDPGITGTICPLVQLHNNSFSEFEEPNYWETEFDQLMKDYKATVGLKEVAIFKKDILNIDTSEELTVINDSLNTMKQLIKPIYFVNN